MVISLSILHFKYRSGWEKRAIAFASSRTRHIKNIRAMCRTPKTFYGVFPHLLMIHYFLHR